MYRRLDLDADQMIGVKSAKSFGFWLAILAALCASPVVRAQMLPVGDPIEDYARVLQLTGRAPAFSFSVRPIAVPYLLSKGVYSADHPWARHLSQYRGSVNGKFLKIGVVTPEAASFFNTARPNGTNDGAVWQGRGATAAVSAGVFAQAGPLSGALRPTFFAAQNRDFELSPMKVDRMFSEFAYATLASRKWEVLTSTIDWPQRPGADGFSSFDLGQSYIRLDYRGVGAGFSSENLWWGPGVQNSISMTNNAPGIRHAFIGTSYPLDVGIGKAEGRWLWGRLHESDYYDRIPENDERFFTAITLSFSPRFVPGFSLGAMRSYHKDLEKSDIEPDDFFLVFQNLFKKTLSTPDNPGGFDRLDQMITVFGRWLLPSSGFELYGEWAKGDHSWDLRDALVQLQHASGYTVGFQKVLEADRRRWIRINGEVTKLEAPRSDIARGGFGGYFYEHVFVRHGYTNRGQVMGAGMGPGSNSQYVGVDLFAPWGRAGGFLQRTVHNNDRYYRSDPGGEGGHQVELSIGGRGMLFVCGFEMEGGLSLGRMLNKYHIFKDDETNVHLTIAVRRSVMGYR